MILFFYNLALLAALVAGAPWWLWKMATTEKYREGLRARLGRVPAHLASRGPVPGGPAVIWLHAVSVGEVLAVSRLVAELDNELDHAFAEMRLVISTTTRTGQALARQRFGAQRVFYCPLDLPWAVRAHLDALRPHMLILAETEFWPNLLNGCFRRGIPVAVVNARISDRSWPRYKRLRWLWAPILRRLSCVLAQSEVDAERLRALGCRQVSVAGNLKFDVRATEEAEATRLLKSKSSGLRIVVAGSTLEGEEAALLAAWPQLLAANPQLVLVIAPRHPERFASVAALLDKYAMPWLRRSEWPSYFRREAGVSTPAFSQQSNAGFSPGLSVPIMEEPISAVSQYTEPPAPLSPGTIILLDTIGELASVYSLASVAFVGGSLVPTGGHNPLEPAQFGVPIVMGSHYANFAAITDDLRSHDALRIAAKGDLAATLLDLLTDRHSAEAMGARAKEVFAQQAGATSRCVEVLRTVLASEVGTEGKA